VTKVLYFHSADVVELIDAEQEGKVVTPKYLNESFYVSDEVKSLKLVKRDIFGRLKKEAEPLYICYSDSVIPSEIPRVKVEVLEKPPKIGVIKAKPIMELEFKKSDIADPKTFKNTMELAILGNLLKPKMKLSGIGLMFIGVIIGFAVMYLLGALGFIAFG